MGGKLAAGKVLVTGGGGFLGGAIVRELIRRGERVRTFSRGRYPDLDGLGVEQVRGDLADPAAVEHACHGVEVVFHTAAKPGVWGDWETYYSANVTGTQNVLQACRRCGVARMIHTSSPSVIFDGTDMEGVDETVPYPAAYHSHYPKTKALAERAVIAAVKEGVRAVILRPHLIWGPGDPHLAPRILERAHRLRIVGNGRNRIDTIYIDNAARAHLLAAEALRERPELSGRIYFISQDDPMPLWDMVNAILNAGGKPPIRRYISQKNAVRIGSALEWLFRTFRIPGEPPMTRFVAEELATAHWFDISAAKRDLGYRPEISTGGGLKRLAGSLASPRFHGKNRHSSPSFLMDTSSGTFIPQYPPFQFLGNSPARGRGGRISNGGDHQKQHDPAGRAHVLRPDGGRQKRCGDNADDDLPGVRQKEKVKEDIAWGQLSFSQGFASRRPKVNSIRPSPIPGSKA